MAKAITYIFCIVLLSFSACKKPYSPAPITAVTNYLVVEGLINISDSTIINLSRTVSVSSASTVHPELKAIITIESNTGGSYALKEIGNGVYAAPSFNLSAANQYRLRIKTANNSSYTSDFVPTKVSPPIDTLAWVAKADGVYITLNTHDSKNTSTYYRWDFNETWEIYTFFTSNYIYTNGSIVPRTAAQQVHHCWGHAPNPNVMLASTATLSQDIIQNQSITFLPITAEKLSWKYSILVKQYTLTKDANDYWTLLKKNTEQLGSIFDAQPSASIGNLHNVNNPQEPVIGYISAGTVTSTRIFIDRYTQLPNNYYLQYFYNSPYNQDGYCTDNDANVSVFSKKPATIVPAGYDALAGLWAGYAPPACADCTVNGGTTTQPTFWR